MRDDRPPPTHPEAAANRRSGVYWLALLLLLWGEFAAVMERYSWSLDLGNLLFFSKIALTLAVTVVVFAGERIRREAVELNRLFGRSRVPWGIIAAQLAVYAAFVRLTMAVSSGEFHGRSVGALVFAGWVMASLLVVAFWCWAALPLRGWWRLLRRRWLGLPLACAVGFAAWAASRYSQSLWGRLSDTTLAAVEACLRLLFADVQTDPERHVIGTPAFRVEIGPPCSGYEGFGLVCAVVGCYLWLCRDSLRFPAALLLLPVGLAASWVFNIARITALIAVGNWGWPAVASGGFHSQAGWLAFNGVALGVVALARFSPVFRRDRPRESGEDVAVPARPSLAPFLLPLMALVGTAMTTAALSEDGFDRFYAARIVTVGLVFWAYHRTYARLGWSWSWAAVGLGLFVFVAWVGLEFLLVPPAAEAVPGFPRLPGWEQPLWLATRILGAVLVVPFAEELAFRGYLLRSLQGLDLQENVAGKWDWFAVLASSLLFGLFHPGRWVAGALAGMIYAGAYYRRGRLADAILAHAVTNAALAAYVLLTGSWSLW